jgi:hypothetical protein
MIGLRRRPRAVKEVSGMNYDIYAFALSQFDNFVENVVNVPLALIEPVLPVAQVGV